MTAIGGAKKTFTLLERAWRSLSCASSGPDPERDQFERMCKDLTAEAGDKYTRFFGYRVFPPRSTGSYLKLERMIGAGGYGSVYLGKPTKRGLRKIPYLVEGVKYAVKRVPLQTNLTQQLDRSLLRLQKARLVEFLDFLHAMDEAAYASACIVRHIACIVEKPWYEYTVMEHLEGSDLYEFLAIRGSTIPEATSAELTRQMFTAIGYMHCRVGVLHRDIKPENFGFARPVAEGEALEGMPPLKLFDFGLSWVLPEVVHEGNSHSLLELEPAGTAAYMAPECWKGKCGPPSDVWSAGIIVYIMLSLELPFRLAGTKRYELAIDKHELEFPGDTWSRISDAAREFVTAALGKDSQTRGSAAELLASPWLSSPGDAPALSRSQTCPMPAKSRGGGKSMVYNMNLMAGNSL